MNNFEIGDIVTITDVTGSLRSFKSLLNKKADVVGVDMYSVYIRISTGDYKGRDFVVCYDEISK